MKLLICLVILFVNSSFCFSSKAPLPPAQEDTLFFDLNNAVITSVGDVHYFDLPVYINSSNTHFSLDFWFKFNESKLTYSSTTSLISEIETYSNFDLNSRFLQSTSSGPTISYQIPNNSNLLRIRFILNNALTVVDTSDFHQVNSLLDGIVCTNELLFSTLSLPSIPMSINSMVNIYPNPSIGSFYVHSSEDAKIELFDISGKEIFLKTNVYADVNQEITSENFLKGVYYLKVFNENFTYTKILVFQ